jgi:benzoyl-CoA reductase/2-hydroxyglutaryl-CoA dehydratase subunit BcrC/BadD/HgdB
MRGNTDPSVAEAKLAWAFGLLSKAFTEMVVAFACTDEKAANEALADLKEKLSQYIAEEDRKLVARGCPAGATNDIAERLLTALTIAKHEIETQQSFAELALRVREAQSVRMKVA